MTAYVTRRNRGPSLLDQTYAILRKGEAKAKKAPEPEPAPAKAAAKKKPAAKKAKRAQPRP